MKGKKIKIETIFECNYELGGCKYKNPENKYNCVGCYCSRVVSQTPSVILDTCNDEKTKPNQTDV